MESIYRSPLRVYLVLAILSAVGILSAWRLPVSLFPNSSKPKVSACVDIELSAEAFMQQYGGDLEGRFRGIRRGDLKVETLVATYRPKNVCYDIDFEWGGDSDEAIKEVQDVGRAFFASFPESYRSSFHAWMNNENSGFLAISFYSPERKISELYQLLEPVLTPRLAQLGDIASTSLYNPERREISIELKPEAMAAFNLFPMDVSRAVSHVFEAYNGGSMTVGDNQMRINFPRAVNSVQELKQIAIPTSSGRTVSLVDIARVDLAVPVDSGGVFKTSGASSVILWGSPKPGGNVKEMAESVRRVVDGALKDLPHDIEYKILVDPSEFIGSAVFNVGKEVALAAGLAVFVLFLFVGSLKNVATAAIEIPLSLVLAFILMRVAGMNLNLISLGGLALSAGMNVDASVVVMENIFRHFELAKGRDLDFEARVNLVVHAVNEVRFAVIASTIASLVVFLPLAFTSALTYAILGDLAKAVVFSHGFSALVALILVPTIRLQLLKSGAFHEKPSLLERPLQRLEMAYGNALGRFIDNARIRYSVYAGLCVALAVLFSFVIPKLPREVIGKPDTDWLMLSVNTQGNTLIRQMEARTEVIENELLTKFKGDILYTFTQINRGNSGFIMFRLNDKRKMESLLKQVEEAFPNTPEVSYWSDSWNPAELPLPDPPDFKVTIRGNDIDQMAETARDFSTELRERKIFDRTDVRPGAGVEESFLVRPKSEQWPILANQGLGLSLQDLADLTRTASEGRNVQQVSLKDERGRTEQLNIRMRYPQNYLGNGEELGALPIGVGSKIVPLKAIATVSLEKVRPSFLRENGRELFIVSGRGKKGERLETKESVRKAEELVAHWPRVITEVRAKRAVEVVAEPTAHVSSQTAQDVAPTIQLEDAQKELTDAIRQLAFAVSLSIILIFVTMVFQFGSLMNAALVLVSIPLGFIGVMISLYVFGSTLSLNSMLGVILLNGLAVANSIILVDFLQRKVKEGLRPRQAAIEVARTRLRPILMTSMTTGLGMLPVAFGLGEGGKILQPLGIAVAGGLLFSMVTTLFVVPSLQVAWLDFKQSREGRRYV